MHGLSRSKKSQADTPNYFLLAVPVLTFGLGTWQVQRRKWKLGLVEKLEEKKNADPVQLPQDISLLSSPEYEYLKVKIRGTFDHSKEMYLMPRRRLDKHVAKEGPNLKGVISYGPKEGLGFNVVTPFHVTDRNEWILVNRGWVPKETVDPRSRPEGQVEGEVELIGVNRLSQPRSRVETDNAMPDTRFLRRDVESMAALSNTAPVFIDADYSSTLPGGPIGGQTVMHLRNEHWSYIITWYTLTAATSLMWIQKYILKRW